MSYQNRGGMQLSAYIMTLILLLDNPIMQTFELGKKGVKLDMAKKSAAYIFTETIETDEAINECISKEWAAMPQYLDYWNGVVENMNAEAEIPPGLRKEHLIAIRAYAQGSLLYGDFNEAVRKYGKSDSTYRKKFHFKCFHYLLSVAMEVLKGNEERTTFFAVSLLFDVKERKKVRLGHFSTSYLDKDAAIESLNRSSSKNTLFKIKTKLGVPIAQFAEEREKEVFIPPTEIFKVKTVDMKSKKAYRIIHLEATGCKGKTATVQLENDALKVETGKGNCPRHCKCK